LAKRKPPDKRGPGKGERGKPSRPASGVGVRRTRQGDAWEFVHPRCALDRAEDLEEVYAMVEGGENEIAIDELRWLLGGCHDFVEAHCLLGQLALGEGDLALARAHFGYGYQLGLTALRRAGMPGPLPYRLKPNAAFFEAGKGLAYCLTQSGKAEMAGEIIDELLRCDPSDPLNVRGLSA